MRMRVILLSAAVLMTIPTDRASAAPTAITYAYDHHIFTVSVTAHPEWRQPIEHWYYKGVAAIPPARFLSCGKGSVIDAGWKKEAGVSWDPEAIMTTLDREISSKLDREAGAVTIRKTDSGSIVFEGLGLTGRHTDLPLAAKLTITALENDVDTVQLPATITQPEIVVTDAGLRNMGIKEVVTVGESVFSKSPVNRRHNIATGLSKFNGVLIAQGEVFSFDKILGPVNDKTGYLKELVIQGDTTIPDYGGGLCQVSTTAFRGPWEYGLPILQRKNHSYAVSYYSPQGTDATVYPPNVDMKFRNDTDGALLIQTSLDEQDRAFFVYYGTRDARVAEIYGPYITNRKEASHEEKTVYTTDIPVGEKRKAGERHDGMDALWYRRVSRAGSGSMLERVFSLYEARPLTYQIGVTAADKAKAMSGALSPAPSWLPSKQ